MVLESTPPAPNSVESSLNIRGLWKNGRERLREAKQRDSHVRAKTRDMRKSNGLGEESGEKERPSPSESFPKSSTALGAGGSLKKTNFITCVDGVH
jgi:hypothetical protein